MKTKRVQGTGPKAAAKLLARVYNGRESAVDALDELTGRKYPYPMPSLLKLIVDLSNREITVRQAAKMLPRVLKK